MVGKYINGPMNRKAQFLVSLYLWKGWANYMTKILVIEDDPAVSNLLTTTLEAYGYEYRAAATGHATGYLYS